VYFSLLFCGYFVVLCFLYFVVVLCIFIFVCTSVGLLPLSESPIAVIIILIIIIIIIIIIITQCPKSYLKPDSVY
jgi:hypothetical protein